MGTVTRGNWRLRLLLLTYLAIGGYYSVRIPLWEAPDEPEHFQYVRYLSQHRALPTERLPSIQLDGNEESNQPPLYYAVGAALTAWVNTDNIAALQPNPYLTWDVGLERNAYVLHTDDERFPYRDAALAAHLLRLLSVAFGALAVFATYRLAQGVRPESWGLPLAAAALAAFAPGFLAITSAVTNDSALVALAALAVLDLVRLVGGDASPARAARLGLWLGLAILAKENALVLLPIAGLALIHCGRAGALRRAAAFGAPLALLAGWWFVRNWLLFGTLIRKESAGLTRLLSGASSLSLDLIPDGLFGYYRSLLGVFGWGLVWLPEWAYRVGLAGVVLLLIGLGLAGIGALRRPTRLPSRPLFWLALTVLVALVVVEARRQATLGTVWGTNHVRFLFPALAAWSVLLAVGLWRLAGVARLLQPVKLLPLGLVALAIVVPGRYVVPQFPAPLPVRTATTAPEVALPIAARFGDSFELAGFDLGQVPHRPGEALNLSLFWKAVAPVDRDYSVFVHVVDAAGRLRAQTDQAPADKLYPPTRWLLGQVIRDDRSLALPNDLGPGRYRLLVGAYYYQDPLRRLPVTAPGRLVESGAVEIGQIEIDADGS